MKHLIIDERMRKIEKEKLEKLGYKLIEIKQSNDIKDSEKLALEAIDQIENKKYYQDFMYQNLVTNIYCYGICFTKKSCTVAFKDIKK